MLSKTYGIGGSLLQHSSKPSVTVLLFTSDIVYERHCLLAMSPVSRCNSGMDCAYNNEFITIEFVLKELAPGVTVDEVVQKTGGKLLVDEQVKEMSFAD